VPFGPCPKIRGCDRERAYTRRHCGHPDVRDRINFHPHLHFLVTEGGMDEAAVSPVLMNMSAGVFHEIPRIDDARLTEIFAREVLSFLVGRELLSPEWAERILSWPHTGFNVHSLVRTKTKIEAERVGKYMIRPLLALERLSFLEPDGKVGYRHGENGAKQETMDYPEFIARVTSHIPDKGQVMVRYYGLYANAHRGKVKKASLSASALRVAEEKFRRIPSKGWAEMIRKVYEVDPMVCPKCGSRMKVVAFLTAHAVIDRIIDHLQMTFVAQKPPPAQAAFEECLWAADPPAEYFP
jgi:Putative transposase